MQITDGGLAKLAEGCGQLTSLHLGYDPLDMILTGCDQVTDEGVAAIAREGLTIQR